MISKMKHTTKNIHFDIFLTYTSILAVTIIIVIVMTTASTIATIKQVVFAAAVSNSTSISTSNNNNTLCLDGNAGDETYWVGYVDGINDFHHIKLDWITAFFTAQAEADYHKGYQAGWADAKVNGTTIDKNCFDTRLGN